MLEVQADGSGSQSWILLQCKDQGSFAPWFSPQDVPSSLCLSLGVALHLPPSPLNSRSSLPSDPSVHTIAVDQNYGQHVILAQHSPDRVPAGLRRPALSAQLDLWSCCADKPSLSAPESAGPADATQIRGGTGAVPVLKYDRRSSAARREVAHVNRRQDPQVDARFGVGTGEERRGQRTSRHHTQR